MRVYRDQPRALISPDFHSRTFFFSAVVFVTIRHYNVLHRIARMTLFSITCGRNVPFAVKSPMGDLKVGDQLPTADSLICAIWRVRPHTVRRANFTNL